MRVESPEEVARICRAKWDLGLRGGIVVANPVPEAHAMDPTLVAGAICSALTEANAQGVSGKALTPFLLARINQLTEGRSLATNVALIRSNATLAAQVAVALCSGPRQASM